MKKEKELLVAVASQKGGVGKSVFTVLLASVLHYRKGLRVAVVDCDYPQHSIALMRERDMESVMKNDDLKVSLYRAARENPEACLSGHQKRSGKGGGGPASLYGRKGGNFRYRAFRPSRNAPQRGGGLYCCCDGLHFHPDQGGQHRHAEFPAVYQGSGRGVGLQEELQPERDLAVLEHGGQAGAEGFV